MRGFPGGASGKESACQCGRLKRHRFNSWVRKIPWRRSLQPIPVFFPGEFHGQRSLEVYAPQSLKEWGTTKVTQYARIHREMREFQHLTHQIWNEMSNEKEFIISMMSQKCFPRKTKLTLFLRLMCSVIQPFPRVLDFQTALKKS